MSKRPHFTSKPLVRVAIAHSPEAVERVIAAQLDGQFPPEQVDLTHKSGGHLIAWYTAERAADLVTFLRSLELEEVTE